MDTVSTPKKKYILLQKDRENYISLVLLNEIINFQHYFPVKQTGEDVFLTQYLESLKANGSLEIKDGNYIPTAKGREALEKFYQKFYDYLKMFDVFCSVDLDKGEFAFSRMNEDMDDEQWNAFINQQRFSDVRVAVADFKGLNPLEIVFMSCLDEGVFDCTASRWQYKLTGDEQWNDIEDISNTAVSVDYLKEQEVIEDVIKKGTEVAIKLIKDAEEAEDEEAQNAEQELIEETTTETTEYVDVVDMPYYGYSYYDPYYDPFYYNPIWNDPYFW